MAADTTIIFPKGNIAIEGANAIVGNTDHRVLAVGQQLSAGSAVSGELQQNIGNDNSWNTLFDEKSMLAMTIRAFKGTLSSPLNRVTRIDAIGIDDAGGGTQATGNITYSGTATESGSLTVQIGSFRYNRYSLAISVGDTASVIGAALESAITADSKAQVSGVNTTGSVALTAEHAGTVGNNIGLKIEGSVAGITIALTEMTGGATDPDLTNLFDPVVTERYQTIIYPGNWGFTALTDFLDPRFNSGGQILDGVGVSCLIDTKSNLESAVNSENSASLIVECNKKVSTSTHIGGAIMELPYESNAYVAAIRALRLTEGASISRFVLPNAGNDNFGGVALSSKPYANTPYSMSPVIETGNGFSQTDIDDLKESGGFVRGNNIAKNSIISGEIVTTYKTDSAANDDLTFKLLNSVDQAVAFRELQYNNIRSKYGQSRLTAGSLIPGVPSVNEDEFRRYLVELFNIAGTPDFSLVVSGTDAIRFFKENISLSIDFATGTASFIEVVPLVSQFREFQGVIQITFDIEIGG